MTMRTIKGTRSKIQHVKRFPPGWFVLAVMHKGDPEDPFRDYRRGDGMRFGWSALLIDVDPDLYCSGLARSSGSKWLDLGKHKTRRAACEALEAMMATRH